MHRVNVVVEAQGVERDVEVTVGSLLLVQHDSGGLSTMMLQPYLITTSNYIRKISAMSGSNIAYAILIKSKEDIYVTVASDHTDVDAERCSIIAGKHTYPKVIARRVWDLDYVENNWDNIELRSNAIINDEKKVAQVVRGPELPQPSIVLEMVENAIEEPRNMVIIVEKKINPMDYISSNYYEIQMVNNADKRSIMHYYWVD